MKKYLVLPGFLMLLLVPIVVTAQSVTSKQPKSLFDQYVRHPHANPLYEVAEAKTPAAPEEETAKAEPPKDTKVDDSATPAAKPAIEEEIETLKARLADLEKKLGENATAPASAPAAHPQSPETPVGHAPEGLQEPPAGPAVDNDTPFAYGDFTWLNGTPRTHSPIFDTKFFTPEIRFDTHFIEDFNQPKDHTMGGATESFRSGEFQLEQVSVGGDFHWDNVRGRVLYMNGLFATTTPRNDASAGVGSWDVRGAYKYTSEAWGGYHFNVQHGLNVDAGIFVSYIGLFSYYNFDNWTYQPSYVSSNTPWFFNGLRIQWFPTNKLKIEPWVINGWQSYNKFNGHGGLGGQILWMPKEWLKFVFNNYGNGEDTLNTPGRSRIHTDDSVEVRYYNKPGSTGISKMAFSLTGDLGCEYGAGVSCHKNTANGPQQSFAGWMAYNRMWWGKDKYAVTLGGGRMNNPGRYLTLLPPINGADAISGSPYFPGNPGSVAHMYDGSLNLQWMPKEHITWWLEGVYRHSDVPYWSGRGGITP
ncbi:MAG TPA: outer membrane beta-barrel protein, partial [Terriglobia bacterium]|nr:outer membrane beta-barrel protein [Terriglobia bacterium]